nr:hypothetical protein [Tanacetum cinerariifolium]
MPSGESPIGGVNVSSSTVSLLTGSLLVMYVPREESLLSRNSRLWNDIATSICIGLQYDRRVEDLQLGVESYQKKLNLTKLDTYQSDLKRAWKGSLEEGYTRETSGCYKGPYDLSYADPIFQE